MNATNPEPRIVHTVEQPTAAVHERIPMAGLSEFFGRAFGTVMAAGPGAERPVGWPAVCPLPGNAY